MCFKPLPGVAVKEIRLLTDLIDFIFWKIASAAGRKMRADGRTELLRGDVSSVVNRFQEANPDGWDSLVTKKMTVILTRHYFYEFEAMRRLGIAEDSFDVVF